MIGEPLKSSQTFISPKYVHQNYVHIAIPDNSLFIQERNHLNLNDLTYRCIFRSLNQENANVNITSLKEQ